MNTQADLEAYCARFHYTLQPVIEPAGTYPSLVVTEHEVTEVGNPDEGQGRIKPVRMYTAKAGIQTAEARALSMIEQMKWERAEYGRLMLKYNGIVL